MRISDWSSDVCSSDLRTVVLLQLDDLDPRIVGGQVGQIFYGCSTPGVNRLVVVADRREHRPLPGQPLHQSILAYIGVLILVYQQIMHPGLPALPYLLVEIGRAHV